MLRRRKISFHQSWAFVASCTGVIIGAILMCIFRFTFFNSWWWLVFGLIILFISLIRPRLLFVLTALIAGIILAFARTSPELYEKDYIRQLYDQTVEVSGIVEGDPEEDEGTIKFKLKNLRFGGPKSKLRIGVLFVSLSSSHKIERGDTVWLKGKLSSGFGSYTGSLYRPAVIKWEKPNPGDLSLKLRNWLAERIEAIIPKSEAGLGLSYLLGIKTNLSKELEDNLRTASLMHVIVTSGTHLGILVSAVRKVFGKFSRFFSTLVSCIVTVFFMSMVGFTPSITRAGIMVILTLLARYSGRKISAWRIIIIVAAITLFINPANLTNQGWLLSFASYAGVMIISPRLQRFLYGKKKPGFIGSSLITSFSATFMTLPIVLYYYGQISLLFFISNLIIMPTLPYVMGSTFLCGIFAGIPIIENIISFIATKMLSFHIWIIGCLGKMKEFLVEVKIDIPAVLLIYVAIALIIGINYFIVKTRSDIIKT